VTDNHLQSESPVAQKRLRFCRIDCILRACFYLALAFLIFTAGVLASQFHLLPATYYADAIEGGKAWIEKRRNFTTPVPQSDWIAATSYKLGDRYGEVTGQSSEENGYTLMAQRYGSALLLTDKRGLIVHSWHMPFFQAWPKPDYIDSPLPEDRIYIVSAYLYKNGDVLAVYQGYGDTPYGYGLLKLDKDSHLLWTFSQRAHHHVYAAHDGRIYALTQQFVKIPDYDSGEQTDLVLADTIVILSPTGKLEESIPIMDAFSDTPYQSFVHRKVVPHYDNTHVNTVMPLEPELASAFPMFKTGQLLVSLRNQSIIAVIDVGTRKVVWATLGDWRFQHDAQFLPNGHILLFDNRGLGTGRKGHSRILEYDPAAGHIALENDGPFDEPFFTYKRGGVQKMDNGNYFAFLTGLAKAMEITPQGKVAWQQHVPDKALFFARHVKADYPEFLGDRK